MKIFKYFSSLIFSRCLGLYLIAGCILFYYGQQGSPPSNKINQLSEQISAELAIIDALSERRTLSKSSYHRAVRYYRKLEEVIGPQSYIFGNIGYCYYHLEDYSKALWAYDQAIKLNPNIYTYYADKAGIYLILKKYKEADFWLKKSINTLGKTMSYYEDIIQAIIRSGDNSLEKNIFLNIVAYQEVSLQEKIKNLFQKIEKDALLLRHLQVYLSFFIQQNEKIQKLPKPSKLPKEKILTLLIKENFPLSFDAFSSRFFSNLIIMRKIQKNKGIITSRPPM